MAMQWLFALVLVCTSVAAGMIALLLLLIFGREDRAQRAQFARPDEDETVFLFDDETLVDASEPASALLSSVTTEGSPWTRLCAFLEPHFPGFQGEIAQLSEHGRMVLDGSGDHPLQLVAEWRGGLARITLSDPDAEGRTVTIDGLSHRAMEAELAELRTTVQRAPVLVWRQTEQGAITWANHAYLTMVSRKQPVDDGMTWPLRPLFDAITAAQPAPRRAKVTLPGEKKPRWFDCHSFSEADGFLLFGVPTDATVQAETALREFIQTLTKTFAHLPIGLAIFDRQRQLALFNPALIDLTGLGPEVLSTRPTLFAFLDMLREKRRMPEPKDYKNWRHQMAALEKAASSGQYEETWSLPSGQTYRVTGRPHPDGAMALLFEDISAEMSLTRRFRAELELGQSVLDTLTEAIAVFSPAGVLVLSNTAYTRLWGMDPLTTLGEIGVAEAVRHWQTGSSPTPVWGMARDHIGAMADREEWSGQVTLNDGRLMVCRLAPLQGDSTLVSFSERPPLADAPKALRRARSSASARIEALALSVSTENI